MVDAARMRTRRGYAARSRADELTDLLRVAALEGERRRVERLLAELLRLQHAPEHRRAALQMRALVSVVESLRELAMSDDLTGLCNRRGFMQAGARFLETAARDGRPAYLIYLDLDNLKQVNDSNGHASGDLLIWQTGNLLRELFPSYGVLEVVGRLGGDEFAALTTSADHATRSAAVMRMRRASQFAHASLLSLSVGVAHFDPQRPVELGELLNAADRAMYEAKRATQVAPWAERPSADS